MIRRTLAVVVLAAACNGHKDKPAENAPAVAQLPPTAATKSIAPTAAIDASVAPVPGSAIDVTAQQLVKDYKSDNISADDKYRNRLVRVTGKLSSIGKDLMETDDPPFVRFATPSGEVSARFPDAAPKSLKVGQTVTLRCTGKGFEMEAAILEDCSVE